MVAAANHAYLILRLLSVTKFERLLILYLPGLLSNATAADALFTTSASSTVTAILGNEPGTSDISPIGHLILPSSQSFTDFTDVGKNLSSVEAKREYLSRIPSKAASDGFLFTRTSALAHKIDGFDAPDFLRHLAYIQFRDLDILGPDYDIPQDTLLKSMPKTIQAQKAWKDLYEKYRIQRMNVCGLDLEPMPKL